MSELPQAVKRRLTEKREDGSVIGVCQKCTEEVYANKDGQLRTRLMSGSPRCLMGGSHLIGRYYYSGPMFWLKRWQGKVRQLPDWATYYIERVQNV